MQTASQGPVTTLYTPFLQHRVSLVTLGSTCGTMFRTSTLFRRCAVQRQRAGQGRRRPRQPWRRHGGHGEHPGHPLHAGRRHPPRQLRPHGVVGNAGEPRLRPRLHGLSAGLQGGGPSAAPPSAPPCRGRAGHADAPVACPHRNRRNGSAPWRSPAAPTGAISRPLAVAPSSPVFKCDLIGFALPGAVIHFACDTLAHRQPRWRPWQGLPGGGPTEAPLAIRGRVRPADVGA